MTVRETLRRPRDKTRPDYFADGFYLRLDTGLYFYPADDRAIDDILQIRDRDPVW